MAAAAVVLRALLAWCAVAALAAVGVFAVVLLVAGCCSCHGTCSCRALQCFLDALWLQALHVVTCLN